MIKAKVLAMACTGCLVVGLVIGVALGTTFLRPDTNKAIVKQLDKDDKAVKKIDKKAEIRYVTREKIKTVIKKVPDTSGCLDYPSPDLYGSVLNAFNNERPPPDRTR